MTFDPKTQPRKGKRAPHVKFELASPTTIVLLAVVNGKVMRNTVTDQAEVNYFLSKAHHTKDGKLYGIFCPGGRMLIPGGKMLKKDSATGTALLNKDTGLPEYTDVKDTYVYVPDTIAPQRTIVGPNGERNLDHVINGQVYRMLLDLSCVKGLELVLVRDDIPTHHNLVLDKNFDPKDTAHI